VVVEDRQLSLAIGKKGQNVRLAAKLTGWRIDIKSEEEKRREVEAQFDDLGAEPAPLSVPGLDEDMVEKLNAAGIETVERMVSASVSELSEVLGLPEGAAEALRQGAEAATMAAGGAVGSGTTEAVPQEGIDPLPGSPQPRAVVEPESPENSDAEPPGDTAEADTDTGTAPAVEPDSSDDAGEGESDESVSETAVDAGDEAAPEADTPENEPSPDGD
jgi:N utilization substance protein A